MSVTGPTEDPELLRIWLCNGCYGRNIYHLYDHGYLSDIDTTVVRNSKITLTITGQEPLVLMSRNYNKHTLYHMDFFDNHGMIFGAIADAPNLLLWSNLPGVNDCWGKRTNEYHGEYSVSNSFVNTEIYFADLRDDLIVYYREEGSYSGSAENDEPMGFETVYADFGGEKPACKSIWIFDAIQLDIGLVATGKNYEKINPLYQPYLENISSTATVKTAASDRSGYCGGVNGFDCYRWGAYQVVDTSNNCNCSEGECPDTVIPYNLNNLFNSFDSFGIYRGIDDYDYSQWADATGSGTWYPITIQPGTYDYPSFINIDPLPHGSWTTDAEGNHFYSMVTKDMKTFNKLNDADPNSVTNVPGSNIVFYPVAPV